MVTKCRYVPKRGKRTQKSHNNEESAISLDLIKAALDPLLEHISVIGATSVVPLAASDLQSAYEAIANTHGDKPSHFKS